MSVPEADMHVLFLAGVLPATDQYDTVIHNFPGNLAHAPWGLSGRFRFKVTLFEDGKEVASAWSEECGEKGSIRLDVGAVAAPLGRPVRGMFILEYHHSKDIPVDVYAFHVHKATGTYVSCNVLPFIGEQLFPTAHADQMENTVFWPGIISDPLNEPYLILVNPFTVVTGVQVHLLGSEGIAARTGNIKLKPKTLQECPIWRLFEGFELPLKKDGNAFSLCVSSQYKLVAYFMVKNKTHQAMSMMDHLHNFCLV